MTDQPHARKQKPIRTEPLGEAELLDLHEADMRSKVDDPTAVPMAPTGVEEGVTKRGGTEIIDIMGDTPALDEPLINIDERLQLDDPGLPAGKITFELDETL